ncbi:hypothetical protein GCM10010156_00010 [Planobispora rosea]|uniref:Uncharacterized protein n=2 Tax=Planobispora rosea TaxID=35762 RepID=A0A8J3RW82_PLARO|nr:hypothetical protein GCM10010156_00010 [Planobispora rosea]GIH82485.1 hypothetical protein Pro02_08930 [Planobispora rosea]
MDWRPTRTVRTMMTFDPEGLTPAQCDGDACVACHKKWPRPRARIGRLPSGALLFACPECADALAPEPVGNVYPLLGGVAFS